MMNVYSMRLEQSLNLPVSLLAFAIIDNKQDLLKIIKFNFK